MLFFVLAIIDIITFVVQGFVFSVLWGWFIVPFGLPALSVIQAIGVGLVITYLTNDGHQPKQEGEDSIDYYAKLAGKQMFRPLMYLFIGFVVLLFS